MLEIARCKGFAFQIQTAHGEIVSEFRNEFLTQPHIPQGEVDAHQLIDLLKSQFESVALFDGRHLPGTEQLVTRWGLQQADQLSIEDPYIQVGGQWIVARGSLVAGGNDVDFPQECILAYGGVLAFSQNLIGAPFDPLRG